MKQHPLRFTVTLSMIVHLAAFVFFQSWELIPIRTKEVPKNTIRIKTIQKPERVKSAKKQIVPERKIPHIKSPEKRQPVLKFQEVHSEAQALKSVAMERSQYPQMQPKTAENILKPNFNFQPAAKSRRNAVVHHSNRVPLKSQEVKFSATTQPTALLGRTQKELPQSISLASRQPAELIRAAQAQKAPLQASLHPSEATQNLGEAKAMHPKNVFPDSKSIAQPAVALVSVSEKPATTQAVHAVQSQKVRSSASVFASPLFSGKKSDFVTSMQRAAEIEARSLQNFPAELETKLKSASAVTSVTSKTSLSHFQHIAPLQMASIPADFSDIIPGSGRGQPSDTLRASTNSTRNLQEDSADFLGEIRKEFSSQVWSRIAQFKHYPRIARDRGFEGQPVVAFTIGLNGELLEISVAKPSPYKMLDQAALDAVQSASPYPSIPESLKLETIRFKLPVSFILEEP